MKSKVKTCYWMGLSVLIVMEYLLFRTYCLREIVPFYPSLYDQTWYLSQSYKLYENIIAKGFLFSAIMHQSAIPQTLLFPTQAAITYLFFGASRMTSLSINFCYFALVQVFSFVVFNKLTGRNIYGVLFIGLLLSTEALTYANDFRLDFISLCLYGMVCCAALRSKVFLAKKWTLITLALGIFLILMRYITGCYLLGVGLVTSAYYLSQLYLSPVKNIRLDARTRIINLSIFNLGILLVFGILFCLNYHIIHDYYIVGHATGAEKAFRLQEALHATGLSSALWYYPYVFFKYHVPAKLLWNAVILLVIFYLLGVFAKNRKQHMVNPDSHTKYYADMLIFTLISIFVPLFILTVDVSKSPLVIGIITVPFIYLLVFCFMGLAGYKARLHPATAKFLLIATAIFIFIQLPHHLVRILAREPGHTFYNQQAYFDDKGNTVANMVDDIGAYAANLHWANLAVAAEKSGDYIIAPIGPLYYETHGVMFNVTTQKLGGSIFGLTRQEAIDSVLTADVFVLDVNNVKPNKYYPFESSIVPYHAQLKHIADTQMLWLGDYFLDNNMLRVYVRPDVYIMGDVHGMITDEGVWVTIPAKVAQRAKSIILAGEGDFKWLHNQHLLAYAATAQGVVLRPLIGFADGHYKLILPLPVWTQDVPLMVHISFSAAHEVGGRMVVMSVPSKKIILFKPKM